LTCSVEVNFQYTLLGRQAEGIGGTYQLTAIISEQVSGWQRVVPLQEEASFTGTAFGTTARLNLCEIKALTQSMEQEADFHPGSYILVITPHIKLNGEVSGRTLKSTFDPALTFRYDHIQFYLARSEENDNPFAVTETGTLREERKEANTLLLFSRELAIPALRNIALFSLAGSLSGLIMLGLRLQNLARLDQAKFFRIRYASVMIDVQNTDAITFSNLIDVASMDALAKLAERFNAMILHVQQNNPDTYYVQAGETTYRFIITSNKTGSTLHEGEATGQEG